MDHLTKKNRGSLAEINYLPSCGTGMCFKAVGQLLDF